MVCKFIFGNPFETEAVQSLPENTKILNDDKTSFPKGSINIDGEKGFYLEIPLSSRTMIFGLGENLGGINKRGRTYVSWCTDDPIHTEEKKSLYGAHNFFVTYEPDTKKAEGFFIDYPGKVTFDAGDSNSNLFKIALEDSNLSIIYIEENTLSGICQTFRKMIGKSYIPPFWAMGFMQSRWGYGSEADLNRVYESHKKYGIPLDALFLDIDYMNGFRDFSVNESNFPDLKKAVSALKEKNIHVVPIIDAGIKVEDAEPDNEGKEKGYFCKKADGTLFAAGVWPGLSHFTDFLNPQARQWFGSLYKKLLDAGIDGFWNDMNEPALFYSEDGLKAAHDQVRTLINNKNPEVYDTWKLKDTIINVQNSMEDYKSFYHVVPEKTAGALAEKTENGLSFVNHAKVHNLYGYNMTRAASEYFTKNADREILLFSRASYIGAHRYGGIWTGDNAAWWSHIELLIHQLPGLNMCGFLYSGCDLGGFGCNTNREILLRFLGIGIWTPLMRNHSALGTREQECYQFENQEDFAALIKFRYRMLPYLYELIKKSSEEGKLYFKPLAFDFSDDETALQTEDQLLLGEDIMIAPVYKPNASGRPVYLPEDMKMVRCRKNSGLDKGLPEIKEMEKGIHFVKYETNEVVFFLRKNKSVWVVDSAENSSKLDLNTKQIWK